MKNKILSKMLMLALIISSTLLISACSVQKDVGISSITILTETSVIEIYEGEFNEANIQASILYEDGSKETITITEDMVTGYNDGPQWVDTPGTYAITILIKGKTIDTTVKVLPKYITVKFYDGYGNVISTQSLRIGSDAVAPNDGYEIEGMEFLGWDRLLTNLTEDTAIHACYGNITALDIESTLTDWQYRRLTDGPDSTYEFYKFANGKVYYYNGDLATFLYSEQDSVSGIDYEAVYTSWVTDEGVNGTWTISFYKDSNVAYTVKYNGKVLFSQTDDNAPSYYNQLCTKYALKYNTWYTWTISDANTETSAVNGYIRIASNAKIEYCKGTELKETLTISYLAYSLSVNEVGIISIVTEETSSVQSLTLRCDVSPVCCTSSDKLPLTIVD